MKKVWVVLVVLILLVSGCAAPSNTASYNLSKAADQFEINRRIVFYNGITGDYILVIEGLCSLGNTDPSGELSVVCKTGNEQYKKHFLGLSDNVTYFAEQIDAVDASPYYYRVVFRPTTIVPDIEVDLPQHQE